MSDIDILQIHQSILAKFKDDENCIDKFETKLQDITESMSLPDLRHRTLKTLEENKKNWKKKLLIF